MRITLSDHFTYQKLLRFTMPSIVMMIVTSVYSIVDGFFVSNCVGKNAFAALNLIFPVLMALSAFGFMVGTGGSALIAKTLGEGKTKEANGIFSMLVAILAVGGAVLVTIVASILDSIDDLGDLRHALPMHYSRAWIRALSPDVAWTDIHRGALWSLIYFVLTVALAFWWFRRKDVLS